MGVGLIAGAGYVGSALAERLTERGTRVLALRRRVDELPAGVPHVAADLTDPSSLDGLPTDIDWVVYAAAPGRGETDGYQRAYVVGPTTLLASLRRRGIQPRRFVFVSSTGVYAERDGGWVDEDSPVTDSDPSTRALVAGERLVREGPVPATVLRLSGIYGPGRDRLLRSVGDGTARSPAGPPRFTNRIHRDDCVGAIVHLLDLAAPAATYLASDHEPVDLGTLYQWLAERLSVPVPPASPQTADAESPMRRSGSKRCRNQRLLAAGYVFKYPSFRDGYAAMLREAGR